MADFKLAALYLAFLLAETFDGVFVFDETFVVL